MRRSCFEIRPKSGRSGRPGSCLEQTKLNASSSSGRQSMRVACNCLKATWHSAMQSGLSRSSSPGALDTRPTSLSFHLNATSVWTRWCVVAWPVSVCQATPPNYRIMGLNSRLRWLHSSIHGDYRAPYEAVTAILNASHLVVVIP